MTGTEASSTASSTADREIVLTRTVSAPRELVWEAYTDEKHITHWWGPRGYTITNQEMDVRVGGMWRFIMHGPDGTDWDNRVVYREIVRPERLVWDHGSDRDDDPRAFHVTITFAEQDGKTTVTQRMVMPTVEQLEEVIGFGAVELGNQTLARLDEYLATM
jgi:uncharacterized protein YndB with AHSA1/START domain